MKKVPSLDVPPQLVKPPKPGKDIWLPTFIVKDPYPKTVAGNNGSVDISSPKNNQNETALRKFIDELKKAIRAGRNAVIDFLLGFIYGAVLSATGSLNDILKYLSPEQAELQASVERDAKNHPFFQAGRGVAAGLGFLAGIAALILTALGTGGSILGSGGAAAAAVPAAVAVLFEKIIEATSRPNADVNSLLSNFRTWLQQTGNRYLR